MGGGSWTAQSFASYSTARGYNYSTVTNSIVGDYSAQDMFKSRRIDAMLDPKNVRRECRDSDEHPNSKPVILALDVTGSMGDGAVKVAKSLNNIMENLYESVEDVEFMVMGIGDLYCDDAPIQASQFESDIRIASQLDKLYFEGGGGGNAFESYTAAWYFGLYHTDLDCLKDGRKGTIITLGDEPLNPYLPGDILVRKLGGAVKQNEMNTKRLYELASKKFNIYHICIEDNATSYRYYKDRIFDSTNPNSWLSVLGRDNICVSTIEALPQTISKLVQRSNSGITVIPDVDSIFADDDNSGVVDNSDYEGISW